MWMSYAIVTLALFVVGGIGGRATEIGPWYRNLNKPSWNPPDWVFPVVWTSIYVLIVWSVGQAWNLADGEERRTLLVVVTINFVLNLLWSILFFTLKRPLWALIEVAMLWVSIVAMMVVIGDINPFGAWLLVPYLVWVSVASLLNLRIVQLNPGLPEQPG